MGGRHRGFPFRLSPAPAQNSPVSGQGQISQLYFHAIVRYRLPAGCRFRLGLALSPRGVLAAGVERFALRVDPARSLARADLPLI
jgi:hypothetical protein